MNRNSNYNNSYTELYHWGVKGMHWGVRKEETPAEKLYRLKTSTQYAANKVKNAWNNAKDSFKWAVESGDVKLKKGTGEHKNLGMNEHVKKTKQHMQDMEQERKVVEKAQQIGKSVRGAYDSVKGAVTGSVDRVRNAATTGYNTVRGRLNHYMSMGTKSINAGFRAAGLQAYQKQILTAGGIVLGAAAIGGIASGVYKHHKKKQQKSNDSER